MAVNPYFRRNNGGEQNLLESLTTEAIKIHGHEMVYIPREAVTEDKILGEEVSKFTDANRIEMYMENAEGFDGESDMTRFGLDIRENCTFVVSKRRFLEVMSHNTDIRDLGRPREGDLIYFDYPYNLFEIKYVEHDNPFYPLGQRYSFKLYCEAFKYTQVKATWMQSKTQFPHSKSGSHSAAVHSLLLVKRYTLETLQPHTHLDELMDGHKQETILQYTT